MTRGRALVVALAALALCSTACSSEASGAAPDARPQIVVTYAVLGSVVREVVGNTGDVVVLMPNGANPHEWSPSARDVERILRADLDR